MSIWIRSKTSISKEECKIWGLFFNSKGLINLKTEKSIFTNYDTDETEIDNLLKELAKVKAET